MVFCSKIFLQPHNGEIGSPLNIKMFLPYNTMFVFPLSLTRTLNRGVIGTVTYANNATGSKQIKPLIKTILSVSSIPFLKKDHLHTILRLLSFAFHWSHWPMISHVSRSLTRSNFLGKVLFPNLCIHSTVALSPEISIF